MKKENISDILGVGFRLFAITAISACLLAVVNEVTSPIIKINTENAQIEANKSVVKEAKSFNNVEFEDESGIVNSISEGVDSNGNTCGYAVSVLPKGYGGEISLTVGIDNECQVIGMEVISQSETAGLGAKCTEKEFQNRFLGKTNGVTVVKNNAKDNEVDAISSATITSKAITKGVNAALDSVKMLKGGNWYEE